MAKVAERFFEQDGKIVHQKTQDWNPMLQRAAQMRQHGGKFGGSQWVGTIDMALLAQIMKERGIKWEDEEGKKEVVMMLLNSRDYRKLQNH